MSIIKLGFRAGVVVAALCCNPVEAQQQPITLSSLTAQGFEIKAAMQPAAFGIAVFLQKGKDVFVCTISADASTSCDPLH